MLASEAVAQARESRDALALGGGLWNLGIARGELGRYEPARQALQAGLDHVEEAGERHYLVRLLNTIGWLYGELGDTETASRWNKQALEASHHGQIDRVTEAERYSLLNLVTDALQARDMEVAAAHLQRFEQMLDHSEYSRFRYLNRYQLLRAEISLAGSLIPPCAARRRRPAWPRRSACARTWRRAGS
jgi:tetratricopeptide (TPR) repeat protein